MQNRFQDGEEDEEQIKQEDLQPYRKGQLSRFEQFFVKEYKRIQELEKDRQTKYIQCIGDPKMT